MKKLLLPFVLLPVIAFAQSTQPLTATPPQSQAIKPPAPKPFASADAMHAEYLHRFLVTPGFGTSRVLVPEFYRPTPDLDFHGQQFIMRAPDLIGLEENPVAYVVRRHRITKDEFTNRTARALLKKRPLTALETNAVTALRAGRDLVTTKQTTPDSGDHLLVLGALRATRDCMKCHECAEGTLLGAFSYTLLPAPAQPADPRGLTNRIAPALLSRY